MVVRMPGPSLGAVSPREWQLEAVWSDKVIRQLGPGAGSSVEEGG